MCCCLLDSTANPDFDVEAAVFRGIRVVNDGRFARDTKPITFSGKPRNWWCSQVSKLRASDQSLRRRDLWQAINNVNFWAVRPTALEAIQTGWQVSHDWSGANRVEWLSFVRRLVGRNWLIIHIVGVDTASFKTSWNDCPCPGSLSILSFAPRNTKKSNKSQSWNFGVQGPNMIDFVWMCQVQRRSCDHICSLPLGCAHWSLAAEEGADSNFTAYCSNIGLMDRSWNCLQECEDCFPPGNMMS